MHFMGDFMLFSCIDCGGHFVLVFLTDPTKILLL
jgi:hypothetical protein